MNTARKLKIVKKIRAMMLAWHNDQPPHRRGPVEAYCLWWAFFTVGVLEMNGIRAALQAGTACWRRLKPEQDDGADETMPQFGYKYEVGHPDNLARLATGRLPEMHCWAAIPDSSTIVDLTTGFQPRQCEMLSKMDWPGDLPPSFMWHKIDELPPGTVYHPEREAINLAIQLLTQWGKV